MMHAFQRHGIDHLSCSSLGLWRSAPGIWAVHYLAKIKNDGNAAMWRGSAVENGLAIYLRGGDIDQAMRAAWQSFDMNSLGLLDDETVPERGLIEPMLRQCENWCRGITVEDSFNNYMRTSDEGRAWVAAPENNPRPLPPLNATQLRVEHWLDNIPIPIVGYLDFAFEFGDVDLKTTKACPSVPRPEHVRQVSLYRAARGRGGGLLYVTTKKHAYFDVDDESMEQSISDLTADALSLRNFLARCDSKEDALRSLPIDYDNFRAPKTKVPLTDILSAG